MSALHHCSTWCRSFSFSLPFPQIISHHRKHNGPVENNFAALSHRNPCDERRGRRQKSLMKFVDGAEFTGAAGAASFRQQVLLIQFCLFFYFLFFITMFLWGTLEVVTVTWLPANAARKINKKFPWLSSERFGLSHCGCHSVVAAYQKHMASPTGCSLSGGRRGGRGGGSVFIWPLISNSTDNFLLWRAGVVN